jgi:catechol 2,3-dioxygenase-like lactoylglutathione lyase family enzyme
MKVDGLHHVTPITADIEANLNFYGRLPGLRPVWLGLSGDDPEMRPGDAVSRGRPDLHRAGRDPNGLFADNLGGPDGVRNLNDWEKC